MPAKTVTLLMLVMLPLTSLYSDIIITVDNMVLNGKIIEENKKAVRFGNFHGVFIIDRDKIREIYRTDSYEDDLKILSGKGRSVNREEVRNNYDSGQKKIDELETSQQGFEPADVLNISLLPLVVFHSGELCDVLPYSYGLSLTAQFPVNKFYYAKKFYISDISVEAGYLFSEKDERSVTAYRLCAGPLWKFSILTGPLKIDWFVSAVSGAGWYDVQGTYDRMNAVKWSAGVYTGPGFTISRITLTPMLRFDYIYDSTAPLYGIGAALSLGYIF